MARRLPVADNLTIRPATDDIVSETLVFALALAAKLERTAVNGCISSARDRLEAEGRPWGRPPRLTRPEAERLRALAAQGLSVRAIAERTKVSRSVVNRALSQNPAGSGAA